MSQTNTNLTTAKPDFGRYATRRLLGTIMQKFANARVPDFTKSDDDDPSQQAEEAFLPEITVAEYAPHKKYPGKPCADHMTKRDVLENIDRGIDPFAADIGGEPNRSFLHPPMRDLIVAARFAALITSPERLQCLAASDAFHVVVEPDTDMRNALESSLETVCALSAALFLSHTGQSIGFEICVNECEKVRFGSKRKTASFVFEKDLRGALLEEEPVIAVLEGMSDLPEDLRVFGPVELKLPQLTKSMLVEILRVTHSATGELAEEAILGQLPEEVTLSALPVNAFLRAFCAPTSLKVAKRLKTYAANLELAKQTPSLEKGQKTLKDMYLSEGARALCNQMLADLKAHQDGQIAWSDVPSSLFLQGPPGNGKTMLAAALAGSAGVKLFSTSYGDCQQHGHQGDFLKSLSDKVNWAIQHAPCVLFIDEFDSFGHRDKKDRGSDYIVGIVNTMLEHLSRLNEAPGVLLVAAANHPDMIDPALLRPGRFDLHATIDVPDKAGIQKILELDLGARAKEVPISELASVLIGSSGAQVSGFVRQAKTAARANGEPVNEAHLRASLPAGSQSFDDKALKRIAIHEAGHVIAAQHFKRPLPEVVRLTATGGHVISSRERVTTLKSNNDDIAIQLAGRAAEEAMFGSVSAGASEDLYIATELAFAARKLWGLYPDELSVIPPEDNRRGFVEERMSAQVNADLQQQYERVLGIVTLDLDSVALLAGELLERRELKQSDLEIFFAGFRGQSSNVASKVSAFSPQGQRV